MKIKMPRSIIVLVFISVASIGFSQSPAVKSELSDINLPAGSKQDKRILSTAAARTLLQMKAEENALVLGDHVEVFSLPASTTKQTVADIKLALQNAGWSLQSFSSEPAYALLKNNERIVLMYLESLKKETAFYLMPVISIKQKEAPVVAVQPVVTEEVKTQEPQPLPKVEAAPQITETKQIEAKPTQEVAPVANSTYTFTTINFDDGWTSAVAPDFVKTTKGNLQVLIYYASEITDQMRDSNLEFSDQFWNLLVVPNFTVKSAVRLQEGVTYFRTYFIEGDVIDPKTNTPHYLALNVLVNNGIATPVLAIAPDRNSYYQAFPEPKQLGNMVGYNKFAINLKDISGTWSSSSGASVNLYNTYTGNYAGMNYAQSAHTFIFNSDGTYSSSHSGTSSVYGTTTFYTQEYKGKLIVTNWDISMTNRWKDGTEDFNAYFEVVRGGRILHLQSKTASAITYDLVRTK